VTASFLARRFGGINRGIALPVAGYGDSDDKTVHSNNFTTPELRDDSIGGLVGAPPEPFGLSEGGGVLVLRYKLASGRT
jgi:hypothetical protein